jgi:hypothetical protein
LAQVALVVEQMERERQALILSLLLLLQMVAVAVVTTLLQVRTVDQAEVEAVTSQPRAILLLIKVTSAAQVMLAQVVAVVELEKLVTQTANNLAAMDFLHQ